MKPHPIALAFPPMSEAEYEALKADIKANGLHNPVAVYEGMILDGRHRDKACRELGLGECHGRDYTEELSAHDGDAIAFAISANVHRRHLSKSQRAMIAANLANLPAGRPKHAEDVAPQTIASLSEALDVSVGAINQARRIRKRSPKTAKKVAAGKVSIRGGREQVEDNSAPGAELTPSYDNLGCEITDDEILHVFASRSHITDAINALQNAKNAIAKTIADQPVGAYVPAQQVSIDIGNAIRSLKFGLPYALCPECHAKGCECCREKGWMPKDVFERLPT
jgi:hypothetical protein